MLHTVHLTLSRSRPQLNHPCNRRVEFRKWAVIVRKKKKERIENQGGENSGKQSSRAHLERNREREAGSERREKSRKKEEIARARERVSRERVTSRNIWYAKYSLRPREPVAIPLINPI